MERADKVFTVRGVDGGLSAYRAVDACDERGRDLDVWDAARVCGCDVSRYIAHHSPAERYDGGVPAELVFKHAVFDPGFRLPALLLFSRGECDNVRLQSRPFEFLQKSVSVEALDRRIGDYGEFIGEP